jgi:UDP-GlcNAc:undecaprenyl-phosphate GlcNAc-1-phosphate transferase
VALQLPFLSLSDEGIFRDAGVVLVAGGLICAVGVLDDLLELDALTKLGGQLIAAGFLVFFEVQYYSFQLPGGGQFALDTTQGALLSVIVVVATVNAVNFVDGLDGLAAGVVGIGAVAFWAFSYQLAAANGETLAITAALLTAALGGACAGFLPHNFFPARIFMGDSGSMLIGLVLAGSALTLTGQFASVDLRQGAGGSEASLLPTLLPIILPIAILVVPFVDLVLAVVRRTRAGRSPFAPDKQHLHHRLLEIGHSHKRAVLIMWLWAGLIAFGGVLASLYSGTVTTVVLLTWVVLTVALTFFVPRVHRRRTVPE